MVETTDTPAAAFPGRRDWAAALAALLIALGVGLACLGFAAGFFLLDDTQVDQLPKFYEIGRLLAAGEFPFLTSKTVWGGNFAFELLYGIYNPVNLALYFVLPAFDDLKLAAAFMASAYLMIAALGLLALGRQIGLGRPAALLVVLSVLTGNFLLYWLAASWAPAFHSFVWCVWSLVFLLRCHAAQTLGSASWPSLAGLALCSALTVSSGYPTADLMLGVAVVTLLGARLWAGQGRRALPLVLAFAAGVLLAAPALLPALAYPELAARSSWLGNNEFNGVSLSGLGQSSTPFHREMLFNWGGWQRSRVPIYFTDISQIAFVS